MDNTELLAMNYLRRAPFSLCVRELNRLLAIEKLDNNFNMHTLSPVLDVGCGDGFWWTLRNNKAKEIYGIDIVTREVKQAKKYIHSAVCDISKTRPFPDVLFKQIIGNCSLEHIRNLDRALINIKKSSDVDTKLILFVPAPQWAFQGKIQRFLLKYLPRISMMVSGAMNGFFQHWHLYDKSIWKDILEHNGWNVVAIHGVGNNRSEFLFRLFLPSSLISFLIKSVTGFYPNSLLRWCPSVLLSPFCKLLSWSLDQPLSGDAVESVYEYVIIAEAKN